MEMVNNLILKINENEYLEFCFSTVQESMYAKDMILEYVEIKLSQVGESRLLGSDLFSKVYSRFLVALTNNIQDHKRVTYLGETVVHFMTLSSPHTIFFLSIPDSYNNTGLILIDGDNNLIIRFTLTPHLRDAWHDSFKRWRLLIDS